MVFMMPVIWRIKSSEWICLPVNKNDRALSEILPCPLFFFFLFFFKCPYLFIYPVSCLSCFFFRVMEGKAESFLSNNLLCSISFFLVCIFLSNTICIFYTELPELELVLEIIWFSISISQMRKDKITGSVAAEWGLQSVSSNTTETIANTHWAFARGQEKL